MSIKIGILGYGNLGRGVEAAVKKNDDVELVAVYTRRNPDTQKSRLTSQTSTRLQRLRAKSALFQAAGIRVCFQSTDFIPPAFSPTARIIPSGARA